MASETISKHLIFLGSMPQPHPPDLKYLVLVIVHFTWQKCMSMYSTVLLIIHVKQCVYIYNGSFRAARLPRQATCAAEPLCHSQVFVVSNKHNWPEFYLGNARACPGLKPPTYINIYHDVQNNLAKCYSLLSQCGINWIYYLYLVYKLLV